MSVFFPSIRGPGSGGGFAGDVLVDFNGGGAVEFSGLSATNNTAGALRHCCLGVLLLHRESRDRMLAGELVVIVSVYGHGLGMLQVSKVGGCFWF